MREWGEWRPGHSPPRGGKSEAVRSRPATAAAAAAAAARAAVCPVAEPRTVFVLEVDGGTHPPMVWRGPMATSYLEQLLRNTEWDNLDYLIIDLPPGTGDIQLTLAQKIPVTGSIIVTTPQDIALLDARRGLKMFEKVNIPIIGIVENMATHLCTECGHEEHIFGANGGEKMSKDYDCELLGSLPLDISIRENLDKGLPSVAKDPNSKISKIYKSV